PPKGIFAVVSRDRVCRNARPADAVKTIASADEVTGEIIHLAVLVEANRGGVAGDIVDADIRDFEQDAPAIRHPARHQVLHHLLLTVDGDPLPHQLAEIDVVQRAVETEVDAVMRHALALHPIANANVDEQVSRPLLDQAGTDAAFDIRAAAALD